MVAAGSSTADIEQTLVSEYGQSILLVPPDTGGIPRHLGGAPWCSGVGALLGVGVVFWRRSRAFDALKAAGDVPATRARPRDGVVSVGEATRRGTPDRDDSEDERWHLRDERDFLQRSLADAEREHDAGDLSDEDHAVLVARDSARLTEVEAELAALGPTAADADPSRGGAEGETRRAEPEVEATPGRRCRCGASSASPPPV